MPKSLPSITIHTDAFDAEILLQGAQLMHFAPRGQKPWIFQNAQTPFLPGREIYAGVPLVFPWFNRLKEHPDAPNHGFARQAEWNVEEQSEDSSRVALVLTAEDVRQQGYASEVWPFEFLARMVFSFGEALGMRLEVENRDAQSVRFECAMHPYFVVSDVRQTTIEGLGRGVWLGDEDAEEFEAGPLQFPPFGARLFLDSSGPVLIRAPERTFLLEAREGWKSSVVWNPGEAMADLIESDWPEFVCVESGALRRNAVSLEAGERYALDIQVGLA